MRFWHAVRLKKRIANCELRIVNDKGNGRHPVILSPLRWIAPLLFTLALLGGATAQNPALAALDRTLTARVLNATVLVLVPDDNGDLVAGGSGTVMDADEGYILTNYHVMGDRRQGELTNQEGIAIIGLMPANLRGAPVLKYVATFVQGDPELDLALLKIVRLLDDEKAQLPDNLGLTAIEHGDSEQLLIGDELFVVGYPGLGGATVTMTSGLVAGFLDEDENEEFEWIKTDAEMNHGNSGGLAVNSDGAFIGVPSGGVADVEAAGKISLVRSGNLALDFYDGARMSASNQTSNRSGAKTRNQRNASGAQILNVQFGEAINRSNEVTRPGVRFDSGLTDLYAAFAYEGFSEGGSFTYVWYYNGAEDVGDTLAWSGGVRGKNWVSLYSEEGLEDGFYELEMLLDGESLFRGGIVIGEEIQSACNFGEVIFAAGVNDAGEPVDRGEEFADVSELYAFFAASGVQNGMPWQTVWSAGSVVVGPALTVNDALCVALPHAPVVVTTTV